jgi:acetylornithine aminotransferase
MSFCPAIALAVLETIETDGLVERAEELGRILVRKISGLDGVREVRGLGLMQGVVLEAPVARLLQSRCLAEGVLVNAISDHILRLLPPLIIEASDLSEAVAAIARALAHVSAAAPVADRARRLTGAGVER